MSQGSLRYPIQQFLRRLIPPFESSRTEFVRALGYLDLVEGRLHVDSWLDRAEGHDLFLKEVAAAYPDHTAELEQALADTAAIRAAEGDSAWRERCKGEEASFVPYIHVQGEQSVPSGICIFGITGGYKRWNTIQTFQRTL